MGFDADWWRYENLTPLAMPVDWSPATRGDEPWDQLDFHLDLGCGTVPKARLGIDRHFAAGVDLVIDLETLTPIKCHQDAPPEFSRTAERTRELFRQNTDGDSNWREFKLPFPDGSIESIITHHCLEHLGDGFIRLMDECHRILKPGGVFRIIVPLFPSYSAVADPDHKRYFMEGSFETFCGAQDGAHWHESFSVPYTSCRFEMVKEDRSPATPVERMWTPDDAREMRVTLRKWA